MDKYNHIMIEEGANFDTDYKIIESHSPDCPACAYEAGIKDATNRVPDIDWFADGIGQDCPHLMREELIQLLRGKIMESEEVTKELTKIP